jgi:serine/threonine protein kinase
VKFCTDPIARQKLVTHEKEFIVRVMQYAGEHPNIVPLLECHLIGETPWLMYEFVEGGTLADTILAWPKLTPAERLNRAIAVLHTIAGAVGCGHALTPAVVHRDLKPANVLMAGTVPRITDYGIGGTAVAYLVAEDKSRGYESVTGRLPSLLSGSYSLMYSSPQQRDGDKPDPRDDVRALGVIAHQMLVGRVDAEVKGNWQKRLKADGAPEALIDLIGASASDEADDRPSDAQEWEKALRALTPPAPTPVPPLEKKWRIDVPGTWAVRPTGNSKATWQEVTNTPAEVTCLSGKEYRLSISSDVTDATLSGLADLKGLTALQHLNLWECEHITDAGVAHLNGLTALQHLNLWECKQITDAGFATIQSHLPRCSIVR